MERARQIQNEICRIIYKMCSTHGNMYATIKEIIRLQGGPDVGGVRAPLAQLTEDDKEIAKACAEQIAVAIQTYC